LNGELNLAADSLAVVENNWKLDQNQLAQDIQTILEKLAVLRQKRDNAAGEIDTQTLQVYERIKAQRGFAVARVVNGACEGCRISLSSAQLQHARSASMEKCANCGRILFCE
jgi:predicted  nucleic acid-binding Zn-ribbon protein